MPADPNVLPDDLPVPADDGACDHLEGLPVPSMPLQATDGTHVDLARLSGRTVIYAYPRTGVPGRALPTGWDDIPGARGCTPQSCAFRDHHAELLSAGASAVYGLSVQPVDYQREAAERLRLPFPLLCDEGLELAMALRLPTFEVDGMRLVRRLTLVIDAGTIAKVFYPVFPPERSAADTLDWLEANPVTRISRFPARAVPGTKSSPSGRT